VIRQIELGHGRDGGLIRLFFVVLLSLLPLQPCFDNPSPTAGEHDHWFVIKMGENSVGYLHEELRRLPGDPATDEQEAVLATASEMRLVLNRMGSRVELRFISSAIESLDGRLLRTDYEMTASNQAIRAEAVVKDGAIEIQNKVGGKTYPKTLTYTGELLGPEGIRQAAAARLQKPGDTLSIQTFVAEASSVGKLTRTCLARERLSIAGREWETVKVEEIFEGLPVKRTVWLDEGGNLVKQQEPGPFGEITVLQSDMAEAMSAASGVEVPKELYQNSVVRANIRLSRAEPVDRLKLRLIHRHPSLGWPDMATPNQEILKKTDKELILDIRRAPSPQETTFPAAMNEENRQYLAPNAYVQSDDSQIQALARGLVGGEKDAFKAALILKRWVAEQMKFDLGIAFAPAAEIIRDRRGTCVGYATLLATLARSVGIPSRIVMGYVYVLGIFGGHAWTEIQAGDQWIPLDAAVVNEGTADATRLAVIVSSLADGPGELGFAAAQQVFGQVGMQIMEFEAAGRTTTVPEGSQPYGVQGDSYSNPWLGVRLKKPSDFSFARLDAVWPDATILGLSGPEGQTVSFEQQAFYPWQDAAGTVREKLAAFVPGAEMGQSKIGARNYFLVDSADHRKAAAAFVRGIEALVLKVEGKGASSLLRRIVKNISLSDN
jgi:hypothetical protein